MLSKLTNWLMFWAWSCNKNAISFQFPTWQVCLLHRNHSGSWTRMFDDCKPMMSSNMAQQQGPNSIRKPMESASSPLITRKGTMPPPYLKSRKKGKTKLILAWVTFCLLVTAKVLIRIWLLSIVNSLHAMPGTTSATTISSKAEPFRTQRHLLSSLWLASLMHNDRNIPLHGDWMVDIIWMVCFSTNTW